jgi:Plasmid stabilisation system protein.
MIADYRLISLAKDEVAEAILHFNEVSTDVSKAFLSDLDRAIDLLRLFPRTGVSIKYGFRSFPLHQFPFSIIYRLENNEIIIVAVSHQSRRPYYWHDRR